MNNSILIAQELTPDMFDTSTPIQFENIEPPRESELPALPATEVRQEQYTYPQSKSDNNSFIFILLIVIVFVIKKLLKPQENINNYDDEPTEKPVNNSGSVTINKSLNNESKKKMSKLTTPNTIRKCIMSFLEITKDN